MAALSDAWGSAPVLLALSVSLGFATGCGHSSDEALRQKFIGREATFEELRELFAGEQGFTAIRRHSLTERDGSVRTLANGVRTEAFGLPADRFARYIQLFDRLGLDGVLKSDEKPGVIVFSAEPGAMLNGDTQKGYWYSPAEVRPIVADLESRRPTSAEMQTPGGFVEFKGLKPHWYLFKAW